MRAGFGLTDQMCDIPHVNALLFCYPCAVSQQREVRTGTFRMWVVRTGGRERATSDGRRGGSRAFSPGYPQQVGQSPPHWLLSVRSPTVAGLPVKIRQLQLEHPTEMTAFNPRIRAMRGAASLMVILIVVVVIAAIGAGWWFVMGPGSTGPKTAATPAVVSSEYISSIIIYIIPIWFCAMQPKSSVCNIV